MIETTDTTSESTQISTTVEESITDEIKQPMMRATRTTGQDTDGYWLVDSAATLLEYLKDSQKLHFRLTADINLGSDAFTLKDGVIIDGSSHIVTYDKGNSMTKGFYVNQDNATVEIRNTQFGNTDGSGAVGYYGFLSGDSAVNMTFIFDTIKYYSNNGQMIYNVNGSIMLRGENEIVQQGTSSYSEEWAETNYIEIQNGNTSIKHSSSKTLAFIWSQSTSSGNPYANTSQIVVKENSSLIIQTNSNMTYGKLSPKYTVEKNASFMVDKVTLATGGTRNRFFNSSSISTINFVFQENSTGVFKLPSAINLGAANGGFSVGSDANVSIDTPSSSTFSANTSSQFLVSLTDPQLVTFSSNTLGTLGLNAAKSSTFGNLAFQSERGFQIDKYTNTADTTPTTTFNANNATLNVAGTTFLNTTQSVDQLGQTELDGARSFSQNCF